MKPEPSARTAPKRDPAKTEAGRVIFNLVMRSNSVADLDKEQVTLACFYLDGLLFLPTGGAKVGRMIRERAKTLGVL